MANLSNINNKFLVTTGGNVLVGQTSTVGNPIFQVAGNSRFSGEIRTANRLAIQETYFGYSSSYKVIQLGESAATKAISLGYNPNANTSGSFSGNEILIPNNIRLMAPAANNNGYYGLMMLNSSNKVLLGSSNYLIESNYIMALDTATKNVGIGITLPEQKLHVEGRGIFDGGNSSDILQIRNDNGGGVFGMTANQFALDLASASAFRIRQGSSVPFYIKSDGNVGIGTSSPVYNLVVSSGGASGIEFAIATATGLNEMLSYNRSTSVFEKLRAQAKQFEWYTDATANALVIQSGGNVGIGTNLPLTKLHVEGVSGSIYVQSTTNNQNASVYFNSKVGTTQSLKWEIGTNIGNGADFEIYDRALGGTRFLIETGTGNVGIGVTGPTFKLDVGGNGRFSGFVEMATGGAVYQGQKFYLDGGGDTFLESPSSNLIEFTTNGVKKMSITSAGEVKIGTTAGANAKLHVVSTAKDRKVMIEGNASNQGAANNITLVNHYPVVSAGTQLIIPFTSQGNLNSTTIIKIFGHSARFNSSDPRGFEATIQVGHLSQLNSVSLLSSSGNISGISVSGMNLIISFTTAYTNPSLSDGVYATINYMTNNISYSLQPNNIVMN